MSDSNSATSGDKKIGADVAEFLTLDYEQLNVPNWDGYDGEPITAETLAAARKLIAEFPRREAPDIAPGGDGTICLEWVTPEKPVVKLYLDIGPGATWSAYGKFKDGTAFHGGRKPIDENTAQSITELRNSEPNYN